MDDRLIDNSKRFVQPFIVNPIKDRTTHKVVDHKVTVLKVRRCFGTFSKKRYIGYIKAGSMSNWKRLRRDAKRIKRKEG